MLLLEGEPVLVRLIKGITEAPGMAAVAAAGALELRVVTHQVMPVALAVWEFNLQLQVPQ